MTMQWFRLYSRIIDDPKLKLLAFEDRWHFVALCCLKSNGLLDEPDSDFRTRQIAVALGVQVRELDEIARRLREVQLVDELLNPNSWSHLQYQSDTSTTRVKKYREKQRRNTVQRLRNVSETVQETEADTETDIPPKGGSASGDAFTPDHVFDFWNADIAPLGKKAVRDRTPERRTLVKGRIRQAGLEGFREVFANIRGSPFLIEAKGIQFDWVMQKKNFTKVLEGNYND